MPRTVKVAVVGSGLAGLTAAYLLARPKEDDDVQIEVHLFEKSSSLGMDSSSISIPIPDQQKEWRIDVPMRSFQGGYYPQLIAMYQSLGVAFRKADFSYSFSLLYPQMKSSDKKITTTMIYNGASGSNGISIPSTFINDSDKCGVYNHLLAGGRTWALFAIMTMQLLWCYIRTLFYAVPIWRASNTRKMTFGMWAENTTPKNSLARLFGMDSVWLDYTQIVLVPLFSAVCTAPEADVIEHPVEEFLDYIWMTLGTHHYVAVNGVRDVVRRLTVGMQHVHVGASITSIGPDQDDKRLVSILCKKAEGSELHAGFHHVVFATQASSAVPLLTSYAAALPAEASSLREAVQRQINCLKTFRYRPTIVINHTDGKLLPDDPRDRRDLNLISLDWEARIKQDIQLDSQLCVPSTYAMATHVLSRPQGYPANEPDVYQTTNPIIPPEESSILGIARLERAVVTVESKEALEGLYVEERRKWLPQCQGQGRGRLGRLQGAGRMAGAEVPGIWICGSFAYAGIPLLEGCVVSARNVVEQGILQCEGTRLKSTPWNS